MTEKKTLTQQERMEKAADMLAFLECQAIEDIDDLADVVGIVARAKFGGWGAEAFSRALALRQI